MNTSISSTSDARTAWEKARATAARPIDTADPRRQELHEYLLVVDEHGELLRQFATADADELGAMYEYFLGPDALAFRGAAPAWAENGSPVKVDSLDQDDNPLQIWEGEQIGGGNVNARVTREDVYLIDEGRIQEGPMLLSVYIGGSDLIELTSAADARTAAHALLAAADGFERVRDGLSAPTVVQRGPGWEEAEIPITKADGSLAVIREKGVNVVDDDGVTASGWCISVNVSDRRLLTADAARTLAEEISRAAALVDQMNAQVRA